VKNIVGQYLSRSRRHRTAAMDPEQELLFCMNVQRLFDQRLALPQTELVLNIFS
jgi:hypothetical protein